MKGSPGIAEMRITSEFAHEYQTDSNTSLTFDPNVTEENGAKNEKHKDYFHFSLALFFSPNIDYRKNIS